MAEPIVLFSPLPPAKSGIADYTAELLPALRALRPVIVVCEKPPPGLPERGSGIITLDEYAQDPTLADCPHVYQIGNNADHVFAYQAFLRRPGVLVQHDFNLHYLVEDATLLLGDTRGYRNVLYEEYGEAGAALADLRHCGLFSEAQKLALPLNTHLLRKATALIVHSQWVHDRLPPETHNRTAVVPHHFAPQVTQYEALSREEARAKLELPRDTFIVLSLGFITPPKQIQATLAALGLLKRRGARILFIVGGERNPGFDIDEQIQLNDLQDSVMVTGYLNEPDFFRHIVAADALVNLRYPSVGESSGTLARALALGLPAIVYNFGPFSEFPDDTVLKVPLELGQPVALAAALEDTMLDPALRHRLSQAAKRHMRTHCSVGHSAARYVELVDRVYHRRTAELARRPTYAPGAGANAGW